MSENRKEGNHGYTILKPGCVIDDGCAGALRDMVFKGKRYYGEFLNQLSPNL